MIELLVCGFMWCFALYGIFTVIQDIFRSYTYKKIKKNLKLILIVNNVEDGIENYVRELTYGNNFYNNLVIIDLASTDDTVKIIEELQNENINIKLLNKENGKDYLKNIF